MDERDELRRAWTDPQKPAALAPRDQLAAVAQWQESGVRLGVAAPKPSLGLCTAWCSSTDVAALPEADANADYVTWAIMASEVLYEVSGRRFRGSCSAVERPGGALPDVGWQWNRWQWGWDAQAAWWGWSPVESGAYDLRQWEPVLCARSSLVMLRNRPVRAVTKVTIAGTQVPVSAFRVENDHELRRIDGGYWPAYQDMSTDSGGAVFTVEYTHGQDPPLLGRQAAAALALLLARSQAGEEVTLPMGVTSLVRQGVSITRAAIAEMRVGGFGVPIIDLFLDTYRIDEPATVWSPDLAQEAPRLGGYP